MENAVVEKNISVEIFNAHCDILKERSGEYIEACHWVAGPLFLARLARENRSPTKTEEELGVTVEDLAEQIKGHHHEISALPAYVSRAKNMRTRAILYHGAQTVGILDTEPTPKWTFSGCGE